MNRGCLRLKKASPDDVEARERPVKFPNKAPANVRTSKSPNQGRSENAREDRRIVTRLYRARTDARC